MKESQYIVLYADEHDTDVWKSYCDVCNVPYSATEIKIYFNTVTYKEDSL